MPMFASTTGRYASGKQDDFLSKNPIIGQKHGLRPSADRVAFYTVS